MSGTLTRPWLAGVAAWVASACVGVAAETVPTKQSQVAELRSAHSGRVHRRLDQDLNRPVAAYPRPPVDRDRQKDSALIECRLHERVDERQPATVVVPLRILGELALVKAIHY